MRPLCGEFYGYMYEDTGTNTSKYAFARARARAKSAIWQRDSYGMMNGFVRTMYATRSMRNRSLDKYIYIYILVSTFESARKR